MLCLLPDKTFDTAGQNKSIARRRMPLLPSGASENSGHPASVRSVAARDISALPLERFGETLLQKSALWLITGQRKRPPIVRNGFVPPSQRPEHVSLRRGQQVVLRQAACTLHLT